MIRSLPSPRLAVALLLLLAPGMTSCSAPKPPANWQHGGATLDLPRARWVRGSHVVDLTTQGEVLVDGEHALTIDRAGRIYEPDGAPVALLEQDGRLVGPDDQDLGQVGAVSAALPDNDFAWLAMRPSGEVVVFDDDAVPRVVGVWMGCTVTPYTQQTCLVLSHLLARSLRDQPRGPPVTFGVGVGVGF